MFEIKDNNKLTENKIKESQFYTEIPDIDDRSPATQPWPELSHGFT